MSLLIGSILTLRDLLQYEGKREFDWLGKIGTIVMTSVELEI